jgi:membrane associated rhomboid family serine protease
MLSDRPYMQDNYPRERTSVHIWLISILGAAFVLELVLLSPWWPAGQNLVSHMILTATALRAGQVWTPLTHGLIHDNSNPFHILFVVSCLYFLGRELNPLLGARRMLAVFIGSLVTGALTWTAVHWVHGGAHFGATAGVLGLFVVLAGVYPDHQLSFLLIPLMIRPRHLLWGVLALDVFGLVLYEILGAPAPFGLAPSAHLGGIFAGWVYYRFFHARGDLDRAPSPLFSWPAWLRRRTQAKPASPGFKVNLSQRSGLRSEVDRILDKINSEGFGSLTVEEKRVLDEAKDLLSRH